MSREIVRLASVGLGGWGNTLADASVRSGAVQITRCFDASEEARAAFADKMGCRPASSMDEVLMDPEVEGVIVATPHSTHADIACQVASAGKHLFLEKPFTLNVPDGKRVIKAAEESGIVLQVGFKRRWFGGNKRLGEMIKAGDLGMVHQLEAIYSRPSMQKPREGWRSSPIECPVGGMTGMGIHMVDLLHSYAGPVKRLSAFSKKLFGKTNLDDVTSIIFEFESGPLGYVGTSTVIPFYATVAAFGTEANAWSENDGAKLYFQKKEEPVRRELPNDPGDGIAEELTHFAHCIREGRQPEAGGPEGLEVVAVLEAIIESIEGGRVVEMSEFRG